MAPGRGGEELATPRSSGRQEQRQGEAGGGERTTDTASCRRMQKRNKW